MVAPALSVLLEDRGERELLLNHWLFLKLSVFSIAVEAGRGESVSVRDSSNLSSQEVSLLSWERRRGVERSVQISSHQVLDRLGGDHVSWVGVWKLDPVFKDAVGDPIDLLVDAKPSRLDLSRNFSLFIVLQLSLQDPVVTLSAVDFTPEPQLSGS